MPKTRAEIQKAYRDRKKQSKPDWKEIKVDTHKQHVKSIRAYAKKVNSDEV